MGSEVKHVETHRTTKEKTTMSPEQTTVMEGNDQAGELAKHWAHADGAQVAEARVQRMPTRRSRNEKMGMRSTSRK